MYYDKHGQPITLDEWCEKLRDPDYKRVGATQVGDKWVSTVWVGIPLDIEKPIGFFETMIFSNDPQFTGEYQWKYSSLTEAEEGHQRIVDALRAGTPLDKI